MANRDFFSGMLAMAGVVGLGVAAYFGAKKAVEIVKERKYCMCDDDEYNWYDDDDDDKEMMTDEEIQAAAEEYVKEASKNWSEEEADDENTDNEGTGD
ncbi:MAG: hypothetical protein DBX47_04045 [Clostridiales bacterium]|nr:MAG: hypothetical protein DBX47_04045 [Clostridiales bacterium]